MLRKSRRVDASTCKVTFVLPAAVEADSAFLVGDFNDWDEKSHPMEKQKDGRFTVTLELAVDTAYQFRYLVNGTDWHNDWEADKYVPNPFSGDNSVVDTSVG